MPLFNIKICPKIDEKPIKIDGAKGTRKISYKTPFVSLPSLGSVYIFGGLGRLGLLNSKP
jgi:hypothetical protein